MCAVLLCTCVTAGQSKVRHHTVKRTSSRSHTSAAMVTTSYPTAGATGRLNGIVAPPQTYQRQLHHRVAARTAAAATTTTTAATRQSTAASAKTRSVTSCSGGGGGRQIHVQGSRSSSEKDEVVLLCPLRHKVTEVCTACLAR